MTTPNQSFGDAADVVRQRYPKYKGPFFARLRQCSCLPPEPAPGDYVKLIESLIIALLVATIWPMGGRFQQHALRMRDTIRLLLKADGGLDPSVRQHLEQREQVWAARAQDVGELMDVGWVEKLGLPRRRDHLSFEDLGREHRGAGRRLFAREASFAMCDIFRKPHDKVVGRLTGLAFGIEALSHQTVRAMRRETGVTRPK
jgi:hypothetical protein